MKEAIGIIASKFEGLLAGTEAIVNLSANTSSTLTLTLQDNYVFYLMEFSALSTASDNVATIRDESTNTVYGFTEIPDVDSKVTNYPLIKPSFQNKMTVLLQNNAGVTSTVTFRLYGILIPYNNHLDFENALYNLVGMKGKIVGGNC